MALLQKDIDTASLDHASVTDKPELKEIHPVMDDADAQDEALWESKFAASQDTLAHLAARARAHRSAGRTKKIGS